MATNFDNGVSNYGVPLFGSSVYGAHWWVDGNLGSDGYAGTGRDEPFATMAKAFANVDSGDTIHVRGNIIENLTAPAGVFDVHIVGPNRPPRHADAHTGSNGYTAATWKASTETDPLLVLQQQGWVIENILFDSPTSDASIEFIRNASAGDAERDSSHARILNCRFAGGATAILITGSENVFDVEVAGCVFNDQTHAIKGDTAWRWNVHDNLFIANTNHIDSGLTQSVIQRNVFGKFTTIGIDLRAGADNVVTDNLLNGTYSNVGGYWASGASDAWGGNRNIITGGITAANPA